MSRSWMKCRLAFLGAAICLACAGGCANTQQSCIDPSGERIFKPKPAEEAKALPSDERYFDDPMNRLPWDDAAVLIEPNRPIMAPVGSEVVLVAGVVGQDGYLRTNRRLEWTIAPGSVGHFVAVEKGDFCDLLMGDFNWPRKIDNNTVIGSTSRSNVRLNRGSCSPDDITLVRRGQSWVSLTSPVEGTSNVTVVAPEVYAWKDRIKSTAVHWVDVGVQFPPPAINPAGTRRTLTTTVLKNSTQTPYERWIVRYEIVGGPSAGFSPDGAASVEVPTNMAGQASVEIFQKSPVPGENAINIQVIRPGDAPGAGGQRIPITQGRTSQTWSTAALSVRAGGPGTVAIGGTASYRFDIVNGGDVTARDLTATIAVPTGFSYVSASPAPNVVGPQLQWRLNEIGVQSQASIQVWFRAEKLGNAICCCQASSAGGLQGNSCVTTTVVSSESGISAPTPTGSSTTLNMWVALAPDVKQPVMVGDEVQFLISVANVGQATATSAVFKAKLDDGMKHPMADRQNIVRREWETIASTAAGGKTSQFSITVQVTKPGNLCMTAELGASNASTISRQNNCVAVIARAAAAPAPVSITVTPLQARKAVGEKITFDVVVKNTGNTALQNVEVVNQFEDALLPQQVSDQPQWKWPSKYFMVWSPGGIPAGGTVAATIEYSCRAAGSPTNRFTVKLPDGRAKEEKAYVDIMPASGTPGADASPRTPVAVARPGAPDASTGDGLSMSVVGLFDAARLGKELTYEIRVANGGTASCREVDVTATVPDGMAPIPLGTDSAKIEGQKIQFGPIAELKPGDLKTYRLRIHAKQQGRYRLHVEVSVPAMPQPLAQDAAEADVRD